MSAVTTIQVNRDYRVDFFRGIALILIFFDHTYGGLLLSYFAFFDASELFICISGYVAYLVYGRMYRHQGMRPTAARIYRRVGKLYIANILIFLAYAVIIAILARSPYFYNPVHPESIRLFGVLDNFNEQFLAVLLLNPIEQFNILPVYMVFLAILPLILYAIEKNMLVTISVSFVVYACTLVNIWPMPFITDSWANPLSWQFLFVIGAAICYLQFNGRKIIVPKFVPIGTKTFTIVNRWNWITIIAVILTIAFMISINLFNRLDLPWRGFTYKELLAPGRLVNFLAVVIIINHLVHRNSEFLRWNISKPITLLGQHSLVVFCTGVLLSMTLGQVWRLELSLIAGIAIMLAGVIIMIVAALMRRFSKSPQFRSLYRRSLTVPADQKQT